MGKGATLPAKVTQDFFVVGGPVQPDRPCYIRRGADQELLDTIAAEQFAYVLAPRASGKSSLMGRAIRRLRADGQMAAVVDLAQIGTRAESVDSARWQYSIAYRICRELRLKVDLQAWWQERAFLPNEQRLVEFFWDIVLARTDATVTIFFDEAERLIDRPFSGELFAALNSAYLRRVSEPEYARLNFVVLGVAAPDQLCPDPSCSPFATGHAVSLDDFTVEECLGFAPGLSGREEIVNGLIERIHGWTHGQPYLTQKLIRSVARKGSRLADLDPALHELFLAPGVSRSEPHLAQMRSLLTDGSARGRHAASMLARLARGGELLFDPDSPAQLLLHLGGFVSSDENGMLRFRNRIVEQVFDADWARSNVSLGWQRPATVGALAALGLVVVAFWYVRVLPRPYIETLSLVTSDYGLAEQAHERLSRLPGFGRRADELLARVMARRSDQAETIAEARAADEVLRGLPGRGALADSLMANYWLRRAEAAVHSGERDVALVQALAAADAGSIEAPGLVANLIDGDYSLLDQTTYFDPSLVAFEVDWDRNQIVGVDTAQRLYRVPIATASGDSGDGSAVNARASSLRLTALQHVGVSRGFFVDEPGRAGALQLRLTVDHQRTTDLLVRLRAPSGSAAELALPRRDGGLEQFIFTGSADNGLLRLADESITGQWELTVFDRLGGETGSLVSWGLSFPGVPQYWDDNPIEGIPLPDPERTEQIIVELSGNGRRAVSIPARPDARGAASVWDLGTGELVADLPLTGRASALRFLAEDRLLVLGSAGAALWQIGAAEPIVEISSAGSFVAPPAISPDGRFFAVADALEGVVRVRLYRNEDGRMLASFETERWRDWALAPEAKSLVVADGTRRGRILDPFTGETQAEFFHERELVRILAAGDEVVAVDSIGAVLAWAVPEGRRTLTPADTVHLGTTPDASSIGVSGDHAFASIVGIDGSISVSRLADGYRLAVLDHGPGIAIGARIDADGARVVSADSAKIRSWRLPAVDPVSHDFGDLSAVAIGANGEFAVLGYRNGQLRLLRNLPESIERGDRSTIEYFGHRGVITSLAINASGALAASGGSDGLIRIWDARSGEPGRYLMRHPAGPINALAFSPDDRWIATAGPRSARVFELNTGTLVNEIEVDGEARAVAFSADGDVVAVGDSTGNIFLVSPDGAQGVQAIRGRSPINVLRFTGTPNILASGSSDGNLVFWSTLEARAVESAYHFSAPIHWIDFSADDNNARVRSGPWLFNLDRSSPDLAITAATLLPGHFRSSPALTQPTDGYLRALASVGGGRLVLADFDLTVSGGSPGVVTRAGSTEADQELAMARDWRTILGLELDPASGLVRPPGP